MPKAFIIKPLSENTYEGLGIEKKGNKIKKTEHYPLLTLEDLREKSVYLILNSPNFFFEVYQLNLPTFNPKLVRIHLQERLNSLGQFRRGVNIYWTIYEYRENFYKIAYLALETVEVEQHLSQLVKIAQVKFEMLTFLPYTLLPLSKEVETAIILHREKQGVWILIVIDKKPSLIEFFPVDEIIGLNIDELNRRLMFLKNYAFREFQTEIKKLLLVNFAEENYQPQDSYEIIRIEEKWPEFTYALELEEEYNFLPEEEKAIKKVFQINYKLAYPIYGLSLLFFLVGLILHYFSLRLETEINRLHQLVTSSIESFTQRYPPDKLTAYRSYLAEKAELEKYPNPYETFIALIQPLQGAKLNKFEIKRVNGTFYSIALAGNKTLPPTEANTFIEQTQKGLSTIFKITQQSFNYMADKKLMLFEISGEYSR